MGISTLIILTCVFAVALGDHCNCFFIYDPVCGTDGITYGNLCDLDCAGTTNKDLKLLKYGVCEPKEEVCICNKMYAPVCGNDGVTYNNVCEFECEVKKIQDFRMKIEYEGECNNKQYASMKQENCFCSMMYSPVCGSDGVTYANPCELDCNAKINHIADLLMKHIGECTEEDTCRCSKIYKPVCGSNGITYDNKCQFLCEKTKTHDYNLKMDHYGGCGTKQEVCRCNKIYAPVCGNDGVTYANECEFECEVKTTNNFQLKINYEDECDKKTNNNVPICPAVYAPVCASNGVTYVNKCMFDYFIMESHQNNIRVVRSGEC